MKRLSLLFLLSVFTNIVWGQNADSYNLRAIGRDKGVFYWQDTRQNLTPEEYYSILDRDLYETFTSAQKQFNRGRTLIVSGVCLTIGAIVAYNAYLQSGYSVPSGYNSIKQYDENKLGIFYITAELADVCYLFGFIFKGIGKGRLEWVKNTYNSGSRYSSTINLAPSLMMTAQNDLGFGVTMKFSL